MKKTLFTKGCVVAPIARPSGYLPCPTLAALLVVGSLFANSAWGASGDDDATHVRLELRSGEYVEGRLLTRVLRIRTSDGIRKIVIADIRSIDVLEPDSAPPGGKKTGGQAGVSTARHAAERLIREDFDISILGGTLTSFMDGRGKKYREYFVAQPDPTTPSVSMIRVAVPYLLEEREGRRAGGGFANPAKGGIAVWGHRDKIFRVDFGNYFTGRIVGLRVRVGDRVEKLLKAYGDRVEKHGRDSLRMETPEGLSVICDTEWLPPEESVRRHIEWLEASMDRARESDRKRRREELAQARDQLEKIKRPELRLITGICALRKELAPGGRGDGGPVIVVPQP